MHAVLLLAAASTSHASRGINPNSPQMLKAIGWLIVLLIAVAMFKPGKGGRW